MVRDLRTFIEQISAGGPRMLSRIKPEVDPSFEMSAVLRRFEADGAAPAVFFEKVKGTALPVLSNVFADQTRLALALEINRRDLSAQFAARIHAPVAPVHVPSGPVKAKVRRGSDVDVTALPQIVHSVGDAGAYITSAITIVRDPDNGVYNAGIYRVQIVGPNKLRINPAKGSDLLRLYQKVEATGQALEVALCVGHHPAMYLASQHRGGSDVSELDIAGALIGEPIRMTPADTIGIDVLADAEIVLEGRILPKIRELEGPFIELAQFENDGEQNPIVEVTAITRRADAIFMDVYSAHPDHNNIGAPAREADLLLRARAVAPSVAGVALPASGAARFTAYVAMEETALARNVAVHLLGASAALKLVVLTNTDVDIYNEAEVQWAIATRVRAAEDVIVLPNMYVTELDPSGNTRDSRSEHGEFDAKWVIDATASIDSPAFRRRDLPRELWEGINLTQYTGAPS